VPLLVACLVVLVFPQPCQAPYTPQDDAQHGQGWAEIARKVVGGARASPGVLLVRLAGPS
jgi:hypothetical protein